MAINLTENLIMGNEKAMEFSSIRMDLDTWAIGTMIEEKGTEGYGTMCIRNTMKESGVGIKSRVKAHSLRATKKF